MDIKFKLFLGTLAILPITIYFIALLDPLAIFSFLFVFILAFLLHKLFFGSFSKDIFINYVYYAFFAVCLAYFHFFLYGEYFDLGGNPLKIGGDDLRYSIEALTGISCRASHDTLLPFSKFLHIFPVIFSLYKEPTHIDLLLVSILAISFIPIFVSRFSDLMFSAKQIKNVSYVISLFCPFLLINSVILYRDGWIAFFFIGALYFFYKKNYFFTFVFLIGELYFRLGSGLLLSFFILMLWIRQFLLSKNYLETKVIMILSSIIVGVIFLVVIFPYLDQYVTSKLGGNLFFRKDFLDKHLLSVTSNQGVSSGMVALYSAPFPIRFLGGILFFLVAPIFSLNYLYSIHGIFWIKQAIVLIFPFLMLFYIAWFIRGLIYAISRKDHNVLILYIIYFFSIVIISQISLQIRHKVMLMPLFYVLVAYGFCFKTKIGTQLGIISSLGLFFLQFFYLLSKAL